MRQLLYFAYGSNMLSDRLMSRVGWLGSCKKVGTHRLYGYRLVFNIKGFANIIPASAHDYVEGVLYSMTARQFKELDFYEGLYAREIFNLPNNQLGAVYVGLKSCVSDTLPLLSYVNVILDGAAENGFKDTYNKVLEFKNSSYELKKGNRHKPM